MSIIITYITIFGLPSRIRYVTRVLRFVGISVKIQCRRGFGFINIIIVITHVNMFGRIVLEYYKSRYYNEADVENYIHNTHARARAPLPTVKTKSTYTI